MCPNKQIDQMNIQGVTGKAVCGTSDMECRNRWAAPGFAGYRRIWLDREFQALETGKDGLSIAALVEEIDGTVCFCIVEK